MPNISNDTTFPELNSLDLNRPAAVIVRKPLLKDSIIYKLISQSGGNSTAFINSVQSAISDRQSAYTSYINKGIMSVVVPDTIDTKNFMDEQYGFFIISKNMPYTFFNQIFSPDASPVNNALNGADNLKTVEDIFSIKINKTTMGISTAGVTLKNAYKKYNLLLQDVIDLDNPLEINQLNETVFEPNDEINIYLPDMDGNLQLCFKGLIDDISETNNKGFNSIAIKAEDYLKKLRITRTNVDPSLNTKEAWSSILAFSTFFVQKKLYDILPVILGKSLTRVLLEEFSFAYQYTQAMKNSDFDLALNLLLNNLDAFITVYRVALPSIALSANPLVSSILPSIITSNVPKMDVVNLADIKSNETASYVVEGYSDTAKQHKVFSFTGTGQPIAQLQFKSGWDFYQSEWKSNWEIVQGLASMFNYQVFTDINGVIRFRPPNFALLDLNLQRGNLITNTGSLYYFTTPLIDSYTSSYDDSKIFNYMVCNGKWEATGDTPEFVNGIVAIQPSIDKFGVRMGKQLSYIGLDTPEQCAAFARAYMDRENRMSKFVSITMMGNALIVPGNTCYLEDKISLYYIENVSYDYTAGGTFTMTLDCTYGRKPLFALPSDVLSDTTSDSLKTKVQQLFNDHIISYESFIKFNNLIDKDLFLQFLWFNDFVWEDVPSIVYEDIRNSVRDYIDVPAEQQYQQQLGALWMTGNISEAIDFALHKETNVSTIRDNLTTSIFGNLGFVGSGVLDAQDNGIMVRGDAATAGTTLG